MAEVPLQPPPAGDPFCFFHLDERVAVYDRRSGRTHLLDALTAEVLHRLGASPGLPVDRLRQSLLDVLDVPSAELSPALIDDALAQLRTAGLVPWVIDPESRT